RERDTPRRAPLADALGRTVLGDATARRLAAWNPYDQNQRADFFDPEWMFGLTDGFDVVIANPPYVRQEQIKERKPELAQQYDSYTGTADLYVYFYERAVQLLREGGVLAFISSNKYFRASYGQKLRRFLADNMTIAQLIDFGDAPVFTAIAYPSIIVARKGKPDEDQELLALNWNPSARVGEFAQIVTAARQSAVERAPAAPIIRQKALTADGWRLEGQATQRLLEKLRRAGMPLGEYVKGRVYRGITSGFNEAFVVDRDTRDRLIAEHPSSEELLKPFLRGENIKRWQATFGEEYLIKIESSANILHLWSNLPEMDAEMVFARSYPAIYSRFQEMRTSLIKRDDQGKYFWELRSCTYWQEFEQDKIISTKISIRPTFAFNRSGYILGNTSYFVAPKSNLFFVLGTLNSNISHFYAKSVFVGKQNGWYEVQPTALEALPIPPTSSPSAIDRLVEQILAAKAADARANVSAQEREIDERVYALYGLRPDEIRTIEESVQDGRAGGTA
ncbi:MAG TPA: TaqI-like C-terminal specificity domain-containing protein, partial [Herpetosiphonaceae bacterium]